MRDCLESLSERLGLESAHGCSSGIAPQGSWTEAAQILAPKTNEPSAVKDRGLTPDPGSGAGLPGAAELLLGAGLGPGTLIESLLSALP